MSVEDVGTVVARTTCKTWRCTPCSKRLVSLFRTRVSAGLSDREPSGLITFTYKWAAWRRADAQFAKRDWGVFLRRSESMKKGWVKVPEMTKRGMIHYHLVVRGVKNPACYPGGPDEWFDEQLFRRRFDCCECFSHRLSREWYDVTKDTYLVHAKKVSSARQTAGYLAKYMVKQFATREGLDKLGVKRRFSFNQRWPKFERARYVQSKGAGGPGWDEIIIVHGNTLSGNPVLLYDTSNKNLQMKTGTEFRLWRKSNEDEDDLHKVRADVVDSGN